MKLKVWNLLNETAGITLFAFWTALLIQPWLNSLNRAFAYSSLDVYQILWVVLVIVLGIVTEKLIRIYERKYLKEIGIVCLILINVIIIFWLDWPLLLFVPLFLLITLFSFRYELYRSGSSFLLDFSIGTLILLLNIISYYNTPLDLNIYTNVILFFIISIFLLFILNIKHMRIYEYSIRPRILITVVFIFIIAVLFLGLFLGLSLGSSFFEGIITSIQWGFRLIGYVILGIIYPFLRLVAPVLEFFGDLDLEMQEEIEAPEGSDMQEGLEQIEPGEGLELEFLEFIPYVLWGLLILLMIWIIYRTISRIIEKIKQLLNREKADEKEGYIEERETIFSFEELQNNFKDFWRNINLFNRKRKPKKEYDDNPVEIIREIYYKFLFKFNAIVSFNLYFTPREYLNNLKNKVQIYEYYQELTDLYNKARYGHEVDEEDVKKAGEIWEKIKKEENKSDK